jgi:hypothetical protein
LANTGWYPPQLSGVEKDSWKLPGWRGSAETVPRLISDPVVVIVQEVGVPSVRLGGVGETFRGTIEIVLQVVA